jgi:hypothetical protein
MTIDLARWKETRPRNGVEPIPEVMRRPSRLRWFARYLSRAARRTHEFPVPNFDPENSGGHAIDHHP